MTDQAKCRKLAEEIASILSQGINLEAKTLEYMDSTFGINTPEELSSFLQNEDESDKESVLQLIFFPSRQSRERLEPILENKDYKSDDIEEVARILTKTTPQVFLYHPFFREKTSIEFNFEYAVNFISRLYIREQLPEHIRALIENTYSQEFANSIKVSLRCAKFDYTPINQELLERALSGLNLQKTPQDEFDFLISLLEETKTNEDLWDFFQRKKIFLKQHLEKAKYIEEQVSSQPMEILMLQGANTLSISSTTLNNQLNLLEDICLQLFGQVPSGDQTLPVYMDRENAQENLHRFFRPE